MTPDEAALAAFAALGVRDWESVLAHAAHIDTPDRPGLSARAAAWRAQALRELGRLEEAERAAAGAVQLAKRADDTAGVSQLRALHASILQGLTATRIAAQERARDATLLDVPDAAIGATLAPAERSALLVRKAGALVDADRRAEALLTAEAARRLADTPRDAVLALLSAARAASDPAGPILDAHAVADASDDMNLVTAVAHAARAAGVPLPLPRFG